MTTNRELRVQAVHIAMFGDDDPDLYPAVFRKLCEEVGELGEALMRADLKDAVMEAGDVGVVLTTLLRLATGTALTTAIDLALDKCEERLAKEADRCRACEQRVCTDPTHPGYCR